MAIDHEVERPRPDARPIIDDSLLATAPTGISGVEAAEVSPTEYDLVVIGSGPAGQKGAIAAAKVRKRVAVIDRAGMIGGNMEVRRELPRGTVATCRFPISGDNAGGRP